MLGNMLRAMRLCRPSLRTAGAIAAASGCGVVASSMRARRISATADPTAAPSLHIWLRPAAALCEAAPSEDCSECYAEPSAYQPPPAKFDDPEENARVLASWRGHIQEARELFAKLDVAGAERVLQIALEEASHFGQSSGPVATSLLNLAQLYRRAGRFGEAEPLLVRAADVLDQTAGPNNKVTLLALLDLAATQLELGKAAEASQGYTDALARLDLAEENQPHGRDALREVRAGCLFRFAKAQLALGDTKEAERKLRDALALVEERHGRLSPRVLAPCAELARVLALQGRAEESSQFLSRAMALQDLRPSQKQQLAMLSAELRQKEGVGDS